MVAGRAAEDAASTLLLVGEPRVDVPGLGPEAPAHAAVARGAGRKADGPHQARPTVRDFTATPGHVPWLRVAWPVTPDADALASAMVIGMAFAPPSALAPNIENTLLVASLAAIEGDDLRVQP